ncbi:PAS domain-containing sensor histidine kinase [Bacteroidales bacterium]
MKTYHAPAERAETKQLLHDMNIFANLESVDELVNALPFIVAVLNKERQVVYSNQTLINALGITDLKKIIGLRPGELLHCVNATKNEGGCGTSENCCYCGAVNAILDCIENNRKATSECRITAYASEKEIAYDLSVTASPFIYNNQQYVILSLLDISNEKRRHALEKIFFHDILNTAGGIRGFLDFVSTSNDSQEIKEFVGIASKLSENLMDEIIAQRQLLAAETGELKYIPKELKINQILSEIKNTLEHHFVGQGKKITILQGDNLALYSDPVLLKRVLINLLKNALEASRAGQTVTLGVKKPDDSHIEFFVHNPGYMSREVQLQIFQRSFSTKDKSRGQGTYSIKLLTEQYLKGSVSFVSQEEEGTTFYIKLPLNPPFT